MNLNIADYSIWIASMILEAVLLAALAWRKHPYPVFKAYLAWQLASTVALFYAFHHFDFWTYFIAYMAAVIIGAAFTTAVAAEVFAHVFRPYSGLPRVYCWIALAMVAAISGYAYKLCNVTSGYLRATEKGIQFAGIAGFAMTIALSVYLCVPRRMHVNGIAMGFLLYIAAQGIVGLYKLPRTIGTGAFVITELLWMAYALRPQPVMEETTEHDLVFANQVVKTLESVQSIVEQRLGMELSYR